MAHVIQTNNCLTAWKDACNYIIANGDGFNLIVDINNPLNLNRNHLMEVVNSGIIREKEISDVINTIFPIKLYNRNTNLPIDEFYNLHEELYNRGKTMRKKNKGRWGNYFLRFTKFGPTKQNQLKNIIDSINLRANEYSACYIMHVSSIDIDSNTRNLGGPCLQYVQFGQKDGAINLTAVYRNHDFLKKSLGNYLGLSRLLEFVCNQTNKDIGTFACHSTHYYLDNRRAVQNCINNLTW